MSDFKISVTVSGPEFTLDTGYGPRTDRNTFATLNVPVSGANAWKIFQAAVAASLEPTTANVAEGDFASKGDAA